MSEPTPEQVLLLKHCLGCRDGVAKKNWGYRNGFCVSVGSEHDQAWAAMVIKGLAVTGVCINDGESRYYHATRDGAIVAGLTKARLADLFQPTGGVEAQQVSAGVEA